MFPDDQVPEDIFVLTDKSLLCKWLCKFATEVRKKDCTPYPLKSSKQKTVFDDTVQKTNPTPSIPETPVLQILSFSDCTFQNCHYQSKTTVTSSYRTSSSSNSAEHLLLVAAACLLCLFIAFSHFISIS